MIRRFRDLYGANPLHLLALTATVAISAYAAYRASLGPLPVRMLVWFTAAVIGHDLVMYPLYAIADRTWHLAQLQVRRRSHGPAHEPAVPAVNHFRVPAVLSGVLLIAFWGTISGQGGASFRYASDHAYVDYLGRWLVVTGVLFAVSAVIYAVRLGRAKVRAS